MSMEAGRKRNFFGMSRESYSKWVKTIDHKPRYRDMRARVKREDKAEVTEALILLREVKDVRV
jgi:hypothetical protein